MHENGEHHGNERSDLYSLGIIVFELLTGQDSMSRRHDTVENLMKGVTADRQPPSLRRWNESLSPGAESIVRLSQLRDRHGP
jgi:serine/threonine protein kinase